MKNRIACILITASLAIGSAAGFFIGKGLESKVSEPVPAVKIQNNKSFTATGDSEDINLLTQSGTFRVEEDVELEQGSRWNVQVGYNSSKESYSAFCERVEY